MIDPRFALCPVSLCVACAVACFGGCRFTRQSDAPSESSAAPSGSSSQVRLARAQTSLGELDAGQIDPFEISMPTIAGTLTIKAEKTDCAYVIVVGGKTVLSTNCNDSADPNSTFPIPKVLNRFEGGPAPFDQVLVVQQTMLGNACNGGPIWFLGLRRDGSHVAYRQIDFCGGPDPVIHAEPGRIVVLAPGGPVNHGTGYVPAETWVFDGRAVHRTSTTAHP